MLDVYMDNLPSREYMMIPVTHIFFGINVSNQKYHVLDKPSPRAITSSSTLFSGDYLLSGHLKRNGLDVNNILEIKDYCAQ